VADGNNDGDDDDNEHLQYQISKARAAINYMLQLEL